MNSAANNMFAIMMNRTRESIFNARLTKSVNAGFRLRVFLAFYADLKKLSMFSEAKFPGIICNSLIQDIHFKKSAISIFFILSER